MSSARLPNLRILHDGRAVGSLIPRRTELSRTVAVRRHMNTRSLVTILVAWGVLSYASIATADTLTATLGEPIEEISHAVRADVAGGVATFRVPRTIANHGELHEEAVLTIHLPAQA